jgi:hypothetical protein
MMITPGHEALPMRHLRKEMQYVSMVLEVAPLPFDTHTFL